MECKVVTNGFSAILRLVLTKSPGFLLAPIHWASLGTIPHPLTELLGYLSDSATPPPASQPWLRHLNKFSVNSDHWMGHHPTHQQPVAVMWSVGYDRFEIQQTQNFISTLPCNLCKTWKCPSHWTIISSSTIMMSVSFFRSVVLKENEIKNKTFHFTSIS